MFGSHFWLERVEENIANYIGEYEKGLIWAKECSTKTFEELADPGDYPNCDRQLAISGAALFVDSFLKK